MTEAIEDKEENQDVAAGDKPVNQDPPATEEAEIVDNDPMILAMKEAEAELAKEAAGEKAPDAAVNKAAEEQKEGDKEADKAPIMIPKPRLDQALADRDRFKAAAEYLQGVVDTQSQMIKGKPVDAGAPADQEGGKTEKAPDTVTDYNALIAKAEDEKLALAKKYEDGEISYLDAQKGIVDLDRQIRAQEEARMSGILESAKKTATDVVQANNRQITVEEAALQIQEQHPYVAEIDQLPEALRNGIWTQINIEAVNALAQKGINPADGTVQSHVALMQEKAKLADVYGPQYTGKKLEPNTNSQGQTAKQPSEKAQQRAAKIDLSQQQPPDTYAANVGGNTQTELTEKDIENMSLEQLADELSRRPQAVHKAAGFRNR